MSSMAAHMNPFQLPNCAEVLLINSPVVSPPLHADAIAMSINLIKTQYHTGRTTQSTQFRTINKVWVTRSRFAIVVVFGRHVPLILSEITHRPVFRVRAGAPV